jgi:hypothetical protein
MSKFKILSILSMLIMTLASCQQQAAHEGHDHDSTSHEETMPMMGMNTTESIPDSVAGSPRVAAMANIGSAHVHIDYSTPAVRDRIIWGGLVPYGQIWVAGAHDATSINFPVDVEIAGQQIPAGKYAFFTIPSETEWTLILNKNWEQHLTRNYSEADDVLRWTVTPETAEFASRLRYDVTPTSETKGRITMRWENLMIGFDVTVIGDR